MTRSLLLTSAVIWSLVGCGCRRESAPPLEKAPPARQVTAPRQGLSRGVRKPPESGTGENAEPEANNEHGPTSSDDQPGPKTYNTGDSDTWPSYDLPLVFELEVPEVPDQITRPAPPISDDEG